MDLTFYCDKVWTQHTRNSWKMEINLDGIDKDDLDNEDVAACVSIENFFATHDEDEIRRYVEDNYDWFNKG